MSKHIFWISSYPKSGNTLVRAIISALFFSKNGNASQNRNFGSLKAKGNYLAFLEMCLQS